MVDYKDLTKQEKYVFNRIEATFTDSMLDRKSFVRVLGLMINKHKSKKKYTIEPLKTAGLFRVINILTKDIYLVDINAPNCSCKKFKYTKKNKAGIKKWCHHIKLCRGLK